MAELPTGYRDVPQEDRDKAEVFFGHGRQVANTGNYEYAISMFIDGLRLDPDAVAAHQELRDISMKRKVSGGKSIGWMEAMKLKRPGGDEKEHMLAGEKLLAYDPGSTDYMLTVVTYAYKGGYYDTVMWIGPILQKANMDLDKKADFSKYIALRDIYKSLHQWRLATDACQLALAMKPMDMDLSTEVKNLGAMETIDTAGYAKAGSFREQVRDMNKQARLLIQDKDVTDMDQMQLMIAQAESEHNAEPEDIGKAMKLVDALEKTEHPDFESRAIELLQKFHQTTGQFRFRKRIGDLNMAQLRRMEKSKRAALAADAQNPELIRDWEDFHREQIEYELKEYQLAADAYPTDLKLRFEIGRRLFQMQRFADAIPVFQQARQDPKFRVDSTIALGVSFLHGGYIDEADDTLGQLIKEYQMQGDSKSKEMYYWRARTLELKNMKPEAIAHYSKVTQWEFNYGDVQLRLKNLRTTPAPGSSPDLRPT